MTDGQAFVREMLTASVQELLESYGVASAVVDPDEAPASVFPELGSIVGFRGKSVRGGLAFVAPVELIAELLPVPQRAAESDFQLRDWSAEIANQLIGRLKNKLFARAVDFDVGTPVCFTGRSLRLVFLPGTDGLALLIRAAGEHVRVYLDCAFTVVPDDARGDVNSPRIAAEGDILLF